MHKVTIKHISLRSVARSALLLGWLVALMPALLLAWIAMQVLQWINSLFGSVEPFDLELLGQTIAIIDPIELASLDGARETVAGLTAGGMATLLFFALIVLLVGALLFVVGALLLALGYNLLAGLGGGITVGLAELPNLNTAAAAQIDDQRQP
jgi:hypothetical protein